MTKRNSPRVFIFGDPVVRRVSSRGGLLDEAIGEMAGYQRGVMKDQRGAVSIDPELIFKR